MDQPGKLIFMVDDDKVIINLLEYVFQGKNGYRIKSFFSGEDCIRNINLNPDLIVLDYVLNESDDNAMNGLETLKKIKEYKNDLPVIVLSGYTDSHTTGLMLENGAMKVLSKDDFFVDILEKYMSTVFQ